MHAHTREIVSCCNDPQRQVHKITARAIRLIKYLSGDVCWTLWRMVDLKHVLVQRLKTLRQPPQFSNVCPCGKQKSAPRTLVKVDAAQFFKAADLTRGLSRITMLLNKVERELGYDAVAVRRSAKCVGFLCNKQRTSNSCKTMRSNAQQRNAAL